MTLLTKPLSRQERRALVLLREGKTPSQIADDMVITNAHVHTLLCAARKKGALVPYQSRGRKAAVPVERLIQIREQCIGAGHGGYGLYPLIASRVGMTANAVKVRLWKYDHRERAAA